MLLIDAGFYLINVNVLSVPMHVSVQYALECERSAAIGKNMQDRRLSNESGRELTAITNACCLSMLGLHDQC